MAKALPRPKAGEVWKRVRHGRELAYIVRVGNSGDRAGSYVFYSHSATGPATRLLDLRNFLGVFAPPGKSEPLLPEREQSGIKEDCVSDAAMTMHINRPSLRVMAAAGRI